MNIASLPPDLREKFEDIAAMSEAALQRLGLNTTIRDSLLEDRRLRRLLVVE